MIAPLLLCFLLLCSFNDVAARRSQRHKRQALLPRSELWPNWTIPYEIHYEFNVAEEEAILKAMREWEYFSCLKFVPATQAHKKIARIKKVKEGCFSDVGAGSDEPLMQLDESCTNHRILLHELGHLLGLHHEHARPDRDQHLQVRPYFAKADMWHTFDVKHDTRTFGLPYSPRSIMHYSKQDFAVGNDLTIEARNPYFTDQIGRSDHLDFKDVQLLNLLYDCTDCATSKPCSPGGFLGPTCRCWCRDDDLTAVDCETGIAIDPSRVKDERGMIIADRRYGHTYFGSNTVASWFEAGRKCRAMGGHLLDVDKKSKSKRLFKLIQMFVEHRYMAGKSSFWTGGNDLNSEGNFVWSTGEKVHLDVWNTQEIDNGLGKNEDCLCVTPNPYRRFVQYRDWDCGLKRRFICELLHKGCFDQSPTCGYYERIGDCPSRKKLCPKSCGVCEKKKKSKKVQAPAPVRPKIMCHQMTCASPLSNHMLLGTKVGSDICVDCPPCSCLRPNFGFRLYPSFTRVCCAVAQMTNQMDGGLHVITRRAGEKHFDVGVANGIVSVRAGPASSAFTVKGKEGRKIPPNACVKFECHTAPRQSSIFNRLGFGQRMCIICPGCSCLGSSIIGFRTYHKKSSACCAFQQMVGIYNSGHLLIKKVFGRSIYSSASNNGLRSRRGFARDNYAFQIVV